MNYNNDGNDNGKSLLRAKRQILHKSSSHTLSHLIWCLGIILREKW